MRGEEAERKSEVERVKEGKRGGGEEGKKMGREVINIHWTSCVILNRYCVQMIGESLWKPGCMIRRGRREIRAAGSDEYLHG